MPSAPVKTIWSPLGDQDGSGAFGEPYGIGAVGSHDVDAIGAGEDDLVSVGRPVGLSAVGEPSRFGPGHGHEIDPSSHTGLRAGAAGRGGGGCTFGGGRGNGGRSLRDRCGLKDCRGGSCGSDGRRAAFRAVISGEQVPGEPYQKRYAQHDRKPCHPLFRCPLHYRPTPMFMARLSGEIVTMTVTDVRSPISGRVRV